MLHSWLDRIPFRLPHRTPSLLDPPDKTITCVPRQGLLFGRFAEPSPLTSYEPNDPLETTVHRLRLCSCPQEKRALVRLRTPARTSPLHLCLRKWTRDKARECWLHRRFRRRERQVQPRSGFSTLTEKVLGRVHHTFQSVREDSWRCAHTHTGESQVEIQMFCRSLIQKEKRILSEQRGIRDFLDLRADHAAQREKAALSRLSLKRNTVRNCCLKNERIMCCLEPDPR